MEFGLVVQLYVGRVLFLIKDWYKQFISIYLFVFVIQSELFNPAPLGPDEYF